MANIERREWLKVAGGLLTVGGLAGCSELDDSNLGGDETDEETPTEQFGGGDLPAVTDFLGVPHEAPAEDPATVFSVHAAVFAWGDDDTETPTPTPTPTPTTTDAGPDDALITNAIAGLIGVAFGAGFAVSGTGLDDMTNFQDDDPETAAWVRISLLGEGVVFSGSFDVESRRGAVTEAGLTETDSIDDYTLFLSEDEGTVVGLGEDYIIISSDDDEEGENPRSALEKATALLQTIRGERDRYHETNEDIEWLLRSGSGAGDVLVGRFTDADGMQIAEEDAGGFVETNVDLYNGAKGVVHHLSGDPDEALDAAAALVYADEDAVDTEGLEEIAGTRATDRSIDSEDNRVVIEATYERDEL